MKSHPSSLTRTTVLPLDPKVAEHHHQVILPIVENWRKTAQVPSVLLLTGLSGVGKRELSFHLAQWMLCEKAGFTKKNNQLSETGEIHLFSTSATNSETETSEVTHGPCQKCSSCLKALRGTWVDFREIGPPRDFAAEPSDDEGSSGFTRLKIEDFREIKNTLGFGAHEGSYRIFLIANAERMTLQAANSLLKLLEEPPPSWVFILTSSDSSLLLPTLVSRCQQIRLLPFPQSTLRNLLDEAKVPREKQDFCIRLGLGSWRRTLEATDDFIWERRLEVLKFLENPPEHLSLLVDWSSSSVESMTLLLDLLEPLQLDLVLSRLTQRPLEDSFLTGHSKYVSMRIRDPMQQTQFWLGRCERLAQARREIQLPLNKKLLVQEILLPYLLS